jgi:hypothetical protein
MRRQEVQAGTHEGTDTQADCLAASRQGCGRRGRGPKAPASQGGNAQEGTPLTGPQIAETTRRGKTNAQLISSR